MTTTANFLTTSEIIDFVKSAPNMVDVESLLNEPYNKYLTRYAIEVEHAPSADEYRSQLMWIDRAAKYFNVEIKEERAKVWAAIPVRFHKTQMYQILKKRFQY